MDEVPINYLAVITAAIANIILGFLWYGPIFGKKWMHLSGITHEKMEATKKKGMGLSYGLMALGSLAMAFVLAHSIAYASTYMEVGGILSGLQVAFWSWLGFVASVTLGTVLWDGKPWSLWLINAGYYLVGLCIMGVVLSSWM